LPERLADTTVGTAAVPPVADDLPGGVAVRLIAGSALLATGHVVQYGLDGRTVGVGTLEI
jgi:hypothetical protein